METRLVSQTISSFIQPELGGTVAVIVRTQIDFVRTDAYVYIQGAGVYLITSISGYVLTLELRTAEAAPGTSVRANILFPVNYRGDDDSEMRWGGPNGKEW